MKKILYATLVLVAACGLVACGSNWTITGNSMYIQSVPNDTLMYVPSGAKILTFD